MDCPTFILVHGAWGGAWCWRDLEIEFDARGIEWVSVDLPSSRIGADPSTSLADDADAVAALAPFDGPTVLVGHSYGGAVAVEVAPRINQLQEIVYLAALVPSVGQSPTGASREVRVRTLLDDAIEVDGEFLRLSESKATAALYNDCSPDVASWATSMLTTQTLASFRSERTALDGPVRSRYIRCSDDHAIDPTLQEVLSMRCDRVITLSSGHSPFLSQPSILCDVLLA